MASSSTNPFSLSVVFVPGILNSPGFASWARPTAGSASAALSSAIARRFENFIMPPIR
jgi:hypothetical protein